MKSIPFLLVFLGILIFAVACKSKPVSRSSADFVYNSGAEPEGLDPHRIQSLDGWQHIMSLFDGLTSKNSAFSEVVPGLAQSWKISKDGKVYTFKIRENLKWSNGEPITVEQIRLSFLRGIRPDVANPNIHSYHNYIVGAKEYTASYSDDPKRAEAEKNYGVKVLSSGELEITLLAPNPLFLDQLYAQQFIPIHPSMSDPSSPSWRDPSQYISSGPFKLTVWEVNKRIVMEKNPHYVDADKVKLQRIIAYPIDDLATGLQMYQKKELDWTGENRIPTTMVPGFMKHPEFHHRPSFGTYFYQFNTKRKPFDDPKVRMALAISLDRKHITDNILKDGKFPTYLYVPPVVGYNPPQLDYFDKPLEERVALAKKLLAEAGFSDLTKFPKKTLLYNTQEVHHKIVQGLQQMWKKNLGIEFEIQNMEWKVYLKEVQAGNFDMSRVGWIGDIPDPIQYMEKFTTTHEQNEGKWSNKEYDRLISEGSAVIDKAKRFEMARRAETILLEEAVLVPLYHYAYYSLMSKEVEGFIPNAFGAYNFKYLSKK